MNPRLDAALQAAARGWPVFLLGRDKIPFKGSHGHLDATTDAAEIERRFRQRPYANLGLATGHLVVVDADGAGGAAELEAAAAPHGGMPITARVVTSGGTHWYFLPPPGIEVQSFNAKRPDGHDGVDVKGGKAGKLGYVMLPPSVTRSGHVYRWADRTPIAVMPMWLYEWIEEKRRRERKTRGEGQAPTVGYLDLPASPEHLRPRAVRLVDQEIVRIRINELPDFLQALKDLDPSCNYDTWFEIGAACHAFDPTPDGLAIFKAFSWASPGHRDQKHIQACEDKWVEYAKPKPKGKKLISSRYVYWLIDEIRKEKIASGLSNSEIEQGATVGEVAPRNTPPQPVAEANGTVVALPAQLLTRTPMRFIDLDDKGRPRPTATNAGVAIENLGVCCRKDTFHGKMLVGGHAIQAWSGDLSDDAVHMLRKVIKREYGFDPGERNARDAAIQLCLEHQFNPVTDYLGALRWDGCPRVGQWVVGYLGSPDTPLNRECGRLMLLAAVRRARHPGCKFDQIIVLEGREGTGKSTALRILAGDDNFSDQSILAASDKEQQEAACGVWIFELAELSGIRRAETERVKTFASRTEDRARPAYGRIRVDMKRQCIFVATTNESAYLKSETGNRRFWPIETKRIDLESLAHDRDQLWAESAYWEAQGASIVLAEQFRHLALEQQFNRLEDDDSWSVDIAEWLDKQGVVPSDPASVVTISDVLKGALHMQAREIRQIEQNRAARILKRLGFTRRQKRDKNRRIWLYAGGSGDEAVA